MNISDLKEFSYYNAHYTGNSYVKALFDETKDNDQYCHRCSNVC